MILKSDVDDVKSTFETRAVGIDFDEESLGERCIKGYCSIFDERDSYGDIVRPGAFKTTLENEFPKKRIKFLHHHMTTCPLGLPDVLEEREKGLWSEATVIKTTRGDDALIEARTGAVDGLSIGFWAITTRLIDANGEVVPDDAPWWKRMMADREILEAKLGEYSLVVFPAAENARVEEVRAMKRRIDYAEHLGKRAGENPAFGIEMIEELAKEVRELREIITRGAPVNVQSPPPIEAVKEKEAKPSSEILSSLEELRGMLSKNLTMLGKS